ncbi:MAG: TrbC/VirB2 family protein [Alphaproteobacteria bacterium]|nr:TrbC/VirB2 family protein [Alphaproteobacteria bacterium]
MEKKKFWLSRLIAVLLVGLVVLYPEAAHAQSALFDSGTNFLTALQDLMTSTWARIIAIIGVVFLGFAWMFGRISLQLAVSVTGGIILVMAAPAIVDSIASTL